MTLGILGGGQLARMLALAAYHLGIKSVCLDPNPKACAQDVTQCLHGEYTDEKALQQLISQADYVTFETENIPLSTLEYIANKKPVFPSLKALEIAQDRLLEKRFLQSLHIPTAEFIAINTEEELNTAVAKLGLPAVLKTRKFGYDGKGQYVIKSQADITTSWQALKSHPLILEKFVEFEYELSIIAVRNRKNDIRYYPITKNQHHDGILRFSEAPLNNAILQQQAQDYISNLLVELDYVGVLTIEFFCSENSLIANEIAPRVHNSGHWTIEGAQCSQFENHIRAIADLPLGHTEVNGYAFMLNAIGQEVPNSDYLHLPGTHCHTYAKTAAIGRKLGHITLVDHQLERYQNSKKALLDINERINRE